ncbi:MAG: acyltransferase [Myxococcales bacterium]|nr:acyltransferase [Myxococcales bacterium]
MTVAAIQTSPRFGEVTANVEAALAAVPPGCDLAVLPELFSTGYQFRSRDEVRALAEPVPDGPTTTRLLAFAAERGTHVVAGLCERAGERLFNSAVLARPDGRSAVYRKVHLFWDEKDLFDPGDLAFAVHEAAGTRIGMLVCFDWMFPEAARALALAGATVLCHPSNLVLPLGPDAMVTRSIENRVFSVTANRVGREHRARAELSFIGLSQIVAPSGQRLARLGSNEPGVAVARIDLDEAGAPITPRNDVWADRRPEMYGVGGARS